MALKSGLAVMAIALIIMALPTVAKLMVQRDRCISNAIVHGVGHGCR